MILSKLDRLDEALIIYKDVIPKSEHVLGDGHIQTLDLYNEQGTVFE